LDARIIFPVNEADWISPIVIQNKKDATEIRVCIDYRSLNNACVHDPFPMPFNDEVLDNVVGNESYLFTGGFSGYHQVRIAEEYKRKTNFMMQWGSYACIVIPFR